MHDLKRINRDLQESLSLDKHPVAILIGAGCPASVRIPDGTSDKALIPDIRGLTDYVIASLAGDECFKNVRAQFVEDGNTTANIEDMLSRVRLLSRVAGLGNVRGLGHSQLVEVERKLCAQISEVVRVELPNDDTSYHHLVDWISAIARSKPLQVFTTNYDLLMEQALEDRQVPFFDGFIGSRAPFFDLRAIEEEYAPARWVRLWKLHGSISWTYSTGSCVKRCYPPPPGSEGVLIHPSELKYDESRRMPYLAMMDRLRAFLRQPSAFLVTAGYSFADDHLNEVILQGARSNPTCAVYGLLFKNFDEEVAAAKLEKRVSTNVTLVAKDGGVVRGTRSGWLKDEHDPHDARAESNLGDFGQLAKFVRNLASSREGGRHA